jgi:ribosomal protein S18 acetylase RimI-like enzyme
MSPVARVEDVPAVSREGLTSIIDQSFAGIYRWHAERTLRSVRWVRQAVQGDAPAGLAMLTTLGQRAGYIYYVAVAPSQRGSGVGGLLLDDAFRVLHAAGAREVFACARKDNTPSIRLLGSRGFVKTGFRELARRKGLKAAAALWMRMVVAPGERVYVKVIPG